MLDWIQQVMNAQTPSLLMVPAAWLVGVVASASSCCNVAVIGAIAGYSGTLSEAQRRKDILFSGLAFMAGTTIALALLGATIGALGSMVGAAMGRYWKFAAGLIVIVFGLVALGWGPFKLPQRPMRSKTKPRGLFGAALYGLAMGGGSTACSVSCNPLLAGIMGYVTLQADLLWGAGILAAFAFGYSLPLAAGLVGLSLGFGRLGTVLQRIRPILSPVMGSMLIVTGFYLLATV